MVLNYKNNYFFGCCFFSCALRSTLFVIIVSCVLFSGCTTVKKIQHMPQLLTLKRYSESQQQIDADAKQRNELFDQLVGEIEQGVFDYDTAYKIEKRFGAPIFSRDVDFKGVMREQWLYRYEKDFSGNRVYIHFDDDGGLVDVEYVKSQ